MRLTYDLKCSGDPTQKKTSTSSPTVDSVSAYQNPQDPCHFTVETESTANCAVASVNIYVRFLNVWGWTHAFFMIAGGVYVAFFGHSHFRPSLVITFAFVTFFITMTVVCEMGCLNFWYSRAVQAITVGQYLYTFFIVAASVVIGAILG